MEDTKRSGFLSGAACVARSAVRSAREEGHGYIIFYKPAQGRGKISLCGRRLGKLRTFWVKLDKL